MQSIELRDTLQELVVDLLRHRRLVDVLDVEVVGKPCTPPLRPLLLQPHGLVCLIESIPSVDGLHVAFVDTEVFLVLDESLIDFLSDE